MYGQDIDIAPLPIGGMLQAMPSESDLRGALKQGHSRLVAAYEVLLGRFKSYEAKRESTLVEGMLTACEIDEYTKISAALLVGMAAGLVNFGCAREWDDDEKTQFAIAVDSAKKMLWGDEGTNQIERCTVYGLQMI